MVSRQPIGAHYGVRDWLVQRVTAVLMALYTLIVAIELVMMPRLDFVAWHQLFAPQWMKLGTLLVLLALFWHAWVGVRNIFMDYVKCSALRLVLHVLAIIWLVVCAVWSAQILWGI